MPSPVRADAAPWLKWPSSFRLLHGPGKNHRISGGVLFRGRIDPGHVQFGVDAVRDVGFGAADIGTEADEKFGETCRRGIAQVGGVVLGRARRPAAESAR